MSSHPFSFEGGELLATMGASWFVSYSYYDRIDKAHMNWSRTSTAETRISNYKRTKQYHQLWLNEVLSMNPNNLNKNRIGLKADEIKNMALSLLNS